MAGEEIQVSHTLVTLKDLCILCDHSLKTYLLLSGYLLIYAFYPLQVMATLALEIFLEVKEKLTSKDCLVLLEIIDLRILLLPLAKSCNCKSIFAY